MEKRFNKVLSSGSSSHSSLTDAEPSRRRTISSKPRSKRPGKKPKIDNAGECNAIDSTVDLVLDREVALVKEEGRVSEHSSKFVHDELRWFHGRWSRSYS